MRFSLKLVSEDSIQYLSTWRERPILMGYYRYIDQSYRHGISPYLDYFDDYAYFQKTILISLLDTDKLKLFVDQFTQIEKIEENINLIWNALKADNTLLANPKLIEVTNDVLGACFHYFKTDYRTVLEYLRVFESKISNDGERGMYYTYRIRLAKYFKDYLNAYEYTEKLFSKADYTKEINDLDYRQIDYFLMAIDLKKDYFQVYQKITQIDFNKTEEFLFCKEFLMIFKIEFAFDLNEIDYLTEVFQSMEENLKNISIYHQEIEAHYALETKNMTRTLFKLITDHLAIKHIPLREFDFNLVTENFFDELDFKFLKKVYEDSSHKIFQNLEKDLKNFIQKLIKKYSLIDPKKTVPSSIVEGIVLAILKREEEDDRIKSLIGLGIRLFRQNIFIKTFKNYVFLRKILLSQISNEPVSFKEIQQALNQKIFPNQTDQAYHGIYIHYLTLLISNVKFTEAIRLFNQSDSSIQKQVLRKLESEEHPGFELFLFLCYYPVNFNHAKKYIEAMLKMEPLWAPGFMFLRYLKEETLNLEEWRQMKNWFDGDEIVVAPFMFYLFNKQSKEEMADFLRSFSTIAEKQILILDTADQLQSKLPQPVSDVDVLESLYLQDPALLSQMPKWEEVSLEQQLFQNQTKIQLTTSEITWDLDKLSTDHPLSKLIERVGIKIKKQKSETDIALIFHCGSLKINARLNAYNQFIVEKNGHSHHEIYEALKSLFYTLFNQNYLSDLKNLDIADRKEAKRKLFKSMIYPKMMKQKLFEEYQHLKKSSFEVIYQDGQNPFESDYFEPQGPVGAEFYRPIEKPTVSAVQFRWVEPHFRAVSKSEIKEKQLELYVSYQIREMIRENHPLFASGKIQDKDQYLNFLADQKIIDPNLKLNPDTYEFEFPQKSIHQSIQEEEIGLIKRPTTFVSGYFKVYPVTE